MLTALAVAAAAATGALVRWRVGQALDAELPWGTLLVNLAGSFALGAIAGWSGPAATVLGTGLLGATTTFSTFAAQVRALSGAGRSLAAATYVAATIGGALALAAAGRALAG